MESVTNLKGFKNCFNQIHFQNNFLSSSITLKVIFDEGCRIRLCINHCFGNIGGNYMLLMDDGLRPSQGFSLPKVIIKLGLTLFSTQRGCIQHFPNQADTLLEMVTRSVYNGSNPHLTHWGRDRMAAASQTTLSNAFSWMKMLEFRLRFHWSLFLRVK